MASQNKVKKTTSPLVTALRKTVVPGSAQEAGVDIQHWIDSSIPVLNVALTGFVESAIPSGRLVEIYGEESVGKTTLACNFLRMAQQERNGIAVLYDTEATLSTERLQGLEVNTDDLLYGVDAGGSVVYIEHIMQNVLEVVRKVQASKTKSTGMIVVDTIAGTESLAERTKKIGEGTSFSPHARALSAAFRKLSIPLSHTGITLLCVNQLKAGAIGDQYALDRNKEATLGGSAMKFHSYMRIRMRLKRRGYVHVGGKMVLVGDEILASLTKHKEGLCNVKATECVLVLRKVPPNAGQFSPGLSAYRTLQHWGMRAKKSARTGETTIDIKGKTYKPLEFETEYDTNATFRDTVCQFLLAYRKARVSVDMKGTVDVPEDEEEEM